MAYNIFTKAVILLSLIAFSSAREFPDFSYAFTRLLNNTWNNLEKAWSAPNDQQWLQSIYSDNTLNQSLISVISPECLLDLYIYTSSLKRKEMWAIQSQLKYCTFTLRYMVKLLDAYPLIPKHSRLHISKYMWWRKSFLCLNSHTTTCMLLWYLHIYKVFFMW